MVPEQRTHVSYRTQEILRERELFWIHLKSRWRSAWRRRSVEGFWETWTSKKLKNNKIKTELSQEEPAYEHHCSTCRNCHQRHQARELLNSWSGFWKSHFQISKVQRGSNWHLRPVPGEQEVLLPSGPLPVRVLVGKLRGGGVGWRGLSPGRTKKRPALSWWHGSQAAHSRSKLGRQVFMSTQVWSLWPGTRHITRWKLYCVSHSDEKTFFYLSVLSQGQGCN